jgi:hypothetical membrane protein
LRAGVIAPAYAFSLVAVLGALQPGFSQLTHGVSLLGSSRTGRHPLVMNLLGFGLTGVMLALCALSFFVLARSKAARAGSVSLVVASAGVVSAGVMSLPGLAHIVIAGITLLVASVGVAMHGASSDLARYPWLRGFTVLVACGACASVPALWLVPREIVGLVQRAGLAAPIVWCGVVAAVRLRELSRS